MATGSVSGSVFHVQRGRSNSKALSTQLDADGNVVQVEWREDEEQSVKLQETADLLLAAGYFRARIKGLTPFDKVVGGMTWCLETCNFDIDADLLFQENLTIGQKIALTEKLVAVLPKMKCPHRLEPHQIQGLDFIHIFPVVQWLVKRSVETREEMGDYIRSYSISQFNKTYQLPQDAVFSSQQEKAVSAVSEILETYKPRRRFRRHDAHKLKDEETRVNSTLLEYGRHHGLRRTESQSNGEDDKKLSAGDGGEDAERVAQEQQLKALMTGMSAMDDHQKLTASTVGSIVGLQSQEIQQIASEYAEKQAELSLESGEKIGEVRQHKRVASSLNKRVQQQRTNLEELETKHNELHNTYLLRKDRLKEVQDYTKTLDDSSFLEGVETEENKGILEKLRSLVLMNESLKLQEQEFKSHCKEEMVRLQIAIDELVESGGLEDDPEDQERRQLIEKQYQTDKEKLHKIRLLLARKNREMAILQRKIDEVPSRAELSQYQRRFIELYNQVAAKHKETKQFYTLYNTLDDTKLYLSKEVNLLNSILDNFAEAMKSASTKEQFLKQFETIVEGIKQNKVKLEKKKQEEKMRRDGLNDTYLDLVEKQRLYFKTVKDLKEECRKNELLLAKLKGQ